MLERLFISYRDIDDASIDLNELNLEDEKKYNVLLTQAFDFDPKGADEEDIIIDYTNTLGKIVSSYAKVKDIKKILATLPGSGLESEAISAPLIASAKAEIKNVYNRLSDLQILESTKELQNMKKRYEKRILSVQSQISSQPSTYRKPVSTQPPTTEVSTYQSIWDTKLSTPKKKNSSLWDKIALFRKAIAIIAIIALLLTIAFAIAYSVLGNTMNSAVMHYDASETSSTVGCGSIRCKYCEGITINSAQYRGPYSFPYYSSISNGRMVCELLTVLVGLISAIGLALLIAIKIKSKKRFTYSKNEFDIKDFFDKNKGVIITIIVIVALIIICILASNSNNNDSGYLNNNQTESTTPNNKPSNSKPQLTPATEPRSGAILTGKEYYDGSEITIRASGGDSYVVKLKTASGITRLSFYVRAGDTVTVGVPSEYLYVYFASGDTWYGEEHLFGEDTSYSMDDDIQNFIDYTWEYTLYPVYNGNFSETPISADQFK